MERAAEQMAPFPDTNTSTQTQTQAQAQVEAVTAELEELKRRYVPVDSYWHLLWIANNLWWFCDNDLHRNTIKVAFFFEKVYPDTICLPLYCFLVLFCCRLASMEDKCRALEVENVQLIMAQQQQQQQEHQQQEQQGQRTQQDTAARQSLEEQLRAALER